MKIPEFINNIISKLNRAGFEAYIVGGSVRDLLMNEIPKDWDITTNAKPDEILKVFPKGKRLQFPVPATTEHPVNIRKAPFPIPS